jgi:DNA-binding XRE family transcriptional regulator
MTIEARVKNAERMMTFATVTKRGIQLTFADGYRGLVPFADIPEIGNISGLTGIELPNPYLINVRSSKGEIVELPWDFVRYYCEPGYRSRISEVASSGMKDLGERIRTARVAAGMTQAELAAAAGIGRVTEVRIEAGEQSPRYDTLVAIATALNRPLTGIITGG